MTHRIDIGKLAWLYPAFLVAGKEADGVILDRVVPGEEELRDLSRFDSGHRTSLVEGLLADLKRWGAPESAIASAERFSAENASAVVTGQQAGIAGGPLYTLYKGIGAIRAAAELERLHPGRAVVPVFWIEGEDHDFDEVRSVGLLERSGDLRTISYDDGDESSRSVATRKVDPDGWGSFIEELTSVLGTTDFSDDLLALLNESYRSEESLVDGFARFIYGVLGEGTPIVLLSASNPALKGLAKDVLEGEALHPEEFHEAVLRGTSRLAADGFPTPIDPRPGHLFMQHEGERLALDPEDGGYRLRRTDRTFSREEVAEIARKTPELLSGNVALRPLLQDAILPTVLYLGGPGEIAYLAQLRELYAAADLSAPVVAPRPFVLLTDPKVDRALDSGELSLDDLLSRDFDPVARVVDPETEERIEEIRVRGEQRVQSAFAEFAQMIEEIDPTLEKASGASATRAAKEIESLAGRLRGALKRTHDTEIRRLRVARGILLPNDSLQERTLSILTWLNMYGIDRMREVLQEVEAVPGEVQVIPVG